MMNETWFVVHSWLNHDEIEKSQDGDADPQYTVCRTMGDLLDYIEVIAPQRDLRVLQVNPAYLALLAFAEEYSNQ